MSVRATVFAAALALAPAAVLPALACDGPPVCTVVDPTGTPLNVRSGPNGKILSTLRKGSKVEVVTHVTEKGKKWAKVSKFQDASFGFVFEAYLTCTQTEGDMPLCVVKDPTGTPLNVRSDPGGEIVGSWINGNKVRLIERRTHKGKPWVLVERIAEDNVVGWVYDPYLKCEEDAE